jgi:hypothetical protein
MHAAGRGSGIYENVVEPAPPFDGRLNYPTVALAPAPESPHEPGAQNFSVTAEDQEVDGLEVVEDIRVGKELPWQHGGEEHDRHVVLGQLVGESGHRSPEGWVVLIRWHHAHHVAGEDVSIQQDSTRNGTGQSGTNGRLSGARCAGNYEKWRSDEAALVSALRTAQRPAARRDLNQITSGPQASHVNGTRAMVARWVSAE